jgi:hypothetical protein
VWSMSSGRGGENEIGEDSEGECDESERDSDDSHDSVSTGAAEEVVLACKCSWQQS